MPELVFFRRGEGAGFELHQRDVPQRVRLFEAELPLTTALRVGEIELLFEPLSQRQPLAAFHGIVGRTRRCGSWWSSSSGWRPPLSRSQCWASPEPARSYSVEYDSPTRAVALATSRASPPSTRKARSSRSSPEE